MEQRGHGCVDALVVTANLSETCLLLRQLLSQALHAIGLISLTVIVR